MTSQTRRPPLALLEKNVVQETLALEKDVQELNVEVANRSLRRSTRLGGLKRGRSEGGDQWVSTSPEMAKSGRNKQRKSEPTKSIESGMPQREQLVAEEKAEAKGNSRAKGKAQYLDEKENNVVAERKGKAKSSRKNRSQTGGRSMFSESGKKKNPTHEEKEKVLEKKKSKKSHLDARQQIEIERLRKYFDDVDNYNLKITHTSSSSSSSSFRR